MAFPEELESKNVLENHDHKLYLIRAEIKIMYYIITHQRNPELPWHRVKATEDATGS